MNKKAGKIEVNTGGIFIDTGVPETQPSPKPTKKTHNPVKDKTSTHAILVMDMSFSMKPQQMETIQGINLWIDKQKEDAKKIGDDMYMTLILFSNQSKVVFESKKIEDVENITPEIYNPNGWTALWDAVEQGVKLAKKSIEKGQYVLLVVDTDGEENCSQSCRGKALETLQSDISGFSAEGSMCEMIYLGASQDAWANANTLGFNANNVANYSVSSQGDKYISLSYGTSELRACRSRGMAMNDTFVNTMSLVNNDIKSVSNSNDSKKKGTTSSSTP